MVCGFCLVVWDVFVWVNLWRWIFSRSVICGHRVRRVISRNGIGVWVWSRGCVGRGASSRGSSVVGCGCTCVFVEWDGGVLEFFPRYGLCG